MGRNKKLRGGQVVRRWLGSGHEEFGVVLDHKQYEDGSTAYLVYPTDRYGRERTRASWVRSTKLQPVINREGNPRKVKGWTAWLRSSTR